MARRLRAVLACALVLVVAGTLRFVASAQAPNKELAPFKGTVGVQASENAPFTRVFGRTVVPDDAYAVTQAASLGTLTLPDSSQVAIGERTAVRVGAFNNAAAGPGSTLTLNHGALRFAIVHPAGTRSNYTFQTQTSQIAVRGTIGYLIVGDEGTQLICIDCAPGDVAITIGGRVVTLTSGYTITITGPPGLATFTITPNDNSYNPSVAQFLLLLVHPDRLLRGRRTANGRRLVDPGRRRRRDHRGDHREQQRAHTDTDPVGDTDAQRIADADADADAGTLRQLDGLDEYADVHDRRRPGANVHRAADRAGRPDHHRLAELRRERRRCDGLAAVGADHADLRRFDDQRDRASRADVIAAAGSRLHDPHHRRQRSDGDGQRRHHLNVDRRPWAATHEPARAADVRTADTASTAVRTSASLGGFGRAEATLAESRPRNRCVEDFDGVRGAQLRAALAQQRLNLQRAAGVRARQQVGRDALHVVDLPFADLVR
jgi:hypothetical protein